MRLILIVAFAAFFAPAAAFAQGAGPRTGPSERDRSAIASACRSDIDRLCPGVQPWGGRIAECMRTHRSSLGGECRAALTRIGLTPR